MLALQSHSVLLQEVLGRLSPGWQLDVLDTFAIRTYTQIQSLPVLEEGSILHEEFRNELLNIGWIVQA